MARVGQLTSPQAVPVIHTLADYLLVFFGELQFQWRATLPGLSLACATSGAKRAMSSFVAFVVVRLRASALQLAHPTGCSSPTCRAAHASTRESASAAHWAVARRLRNGSCETSNRDRSGKGTIRALDTAHRATVSIAC
ncbi:MAG: hypothetical protein EAZ24_01995 [Burkholderiales bacterium]|nr:MAG: hypothetical protein EAZ21_06855 [Betaproteobacteria bacterium]TAG84091.1 MAG: hypothetical protein EAZ24_01995 [Burkholderiales bacterium]